MRLCFLLGGLGPSGGVSVVLEHAARLAVDHECDVAVAVRSPEAEHPHGRSDRVRLISFDDACAERFDIAVATWWETAYRLFDVPAERYAYFLQSFEDRFYPEGSVERLLAAASHDLPVSFVTEARWIADALAEIRPDAPCLVVPNGIDKGVFAPPAEPRVPAPGALRVVVEGHPDVWYKAVGDALDALRRMTRPCHVTVVSPAGAIGADTADEVLGPLTQEQMAEVYRRSDVLLKLSRVEGMFMPPLEAFHTGATCVVSAVTGHDEFVVHGWNGIVTEWDDPWGAARWLDVLATDRALLTFLRSNALKTAREWPSWEQSSARMAAALGSIREGPPPDPVPAARQGLRDLSAGLETLRGERIVLEQELLTRTDELFRHVALLDETFQSRAYRLGAALRAPVLAARRLVRRR